MKDILKSFKEIKDENVGKVEDFMSKHYILVGSITGTIVGSFTALLCICTVYKNAYNVGLNDGLNARNKMIKEMANMSKESN